MADAINVDRWTGRPEITPWDLNVRPWPWPDGSVARIYALDILEHLDDWLATIAEVHRILRPGGVMVVRLPRWNAEQSWFDGTHRRMGTPETFGFWQPGHWRHDKYPQYHEGRQFRLLGISDGPNEITYTLERV